MRALGLALIAGVIAVSGLTVSVEAADAVTKGPVSYKWETEKGSPYKNLRVTNTTRQCVKVGYEVTGETGYDTFWLGTRASGHGSMLIWGGFEPEVSMSQVKVRILKRQAC